MDVTDLWSALYSVPQASVGVTGTVINPSGIVAFLSGNLQFTPGTLDQIGRHPRPDILQGTVTWLFSDRWFLYGKEFGLGGQVDRRVRFDPDGPMQCELDISRTTRLVQATVRVDFGATSFGLEERDGLYVGDATAIGGTEPHLYALAFPDPPHSNEPPR